MRIKPNPAVTDAEYSLEETLLDLEEKAAAERREQIRNAHSADLELQFLAAECFARYKALAVLAERHSEEYAQAFAEAVREFCAGRPE